jgi:hypothetical protein
MFRAFADRRLRPAGAGDRESVGNRAGALPAVSDSVWPVQTKWAGRTSIRTAKS